MKTYRCTYWVRSQKECEVMAENAEAALDIVADGFAGLEITIEEEFDDSKESEALEIADETEGK